MKKIISLILFLLCLTSFSNLANEAEETYLSEEQLNAFFEMMQSSLCTVKMPVGMCACVAEDMQTVFEKNQNRILASEVNELLKQSTETCMFSTGYVETLMKRASVTCYIKAPSQADMLEGKSLEELAELYPEKAEMCQCFQKGMDQQDPREFWKYSQEAYSVYQRRADCMAGLKSLEECKKEVPSPVWLAMQKIENECGIKEDKVKEDKVKEE